MGLIAPAFHGVVQRGSSQPFEVVGVIRVWQTVDLHRHEISDPVGFHDISAAQVRVDQRRCRFRR